ncbi:hypothetical protein CYMTET_55961 [Cymbomonas tetramitiformis]|uniref:EF-hand domain-containing protein n=1 Tax=Cymbomonas tetramitiformis TaxID=36881 RepID=A0AAE0BD35_9CHLO|nr:hypothetical protein CYMTET_55961 [Cymbomonas tetramitiformis]
MKLSTYILKTLEAKAGFSTQRSVTIIDPPLAVVYYVLCSLATIYVCITIFGDKTFLEQEDPIGLVTPYMYSQHTSDTGVVTDFSTAKDDFYDELLAAGGLAPGYETYKFCNNPEYDYKETEDYTYFNIGCLPLSFHEAFKKLSMGELFVKTMLDYSRVGSIFTRRREDCTEAAMRAAAMYDSEYCLEESVVSYEAGVCSCTSRQANFLYGIENLTLVVEHQFEGGGEDGKDPKTVLKRKGSSESLATYEKGEKVEIPLHHLLELAGVSLDSRQTDKAFAGYNQNGEDTFAHVRLTGLTLKLNFIYQNWKKGLEEGDVEGVLEIEGVRNWVSAGNDPKYDSLVSGLEGRQLMVNHFAYGISIQFQISGTIYHFEYHALIRVLTEGVVMLNIAGVLTTFLATNLPMRNETKMYKQAIKLKFLPRRTMARFALNAIHHLDVFRQQDHDKSNFISRLEIHKLIKDSMFGELLEDNELKVLTEFIVMESDTHVDKVRRIGDGRVTAQEWCNILSEEGTDLHMLLEYLKKDLDEGEKQLYINRFNGVTSAKERKHRDNANTENDFLKPLPSQSFAAEEEQVEPPGALP